MQRRKQRGDNTVGETKGHKGREERDEGRRQGRQYDRKHGRIARKGGEGGRSQ